MSENAILRYSDQKRGKRMTEADANHELVTGGYYHPQHVRHSISRDGKTETIITDWWNKTGRRARITLTFSI